jgi:hypothetical protein
VLDKGNEVVEAGEPAPSQAGQKVIIAHLLVQNGMVKAKISALPSAPIPLPKIEMADLGKETGGTSIGDALSEIGGTFYDSIIGSVSSVTGFAGDALKGAGALTFGALGAMTGGATDGLVGMSEKDKTEMSEETEPEKKKHRIFKRRIFPR